jgi:hypothetical protein
MQDSFVLLVSCQIRGNLTTEPFTVAKFGEVAPFTFAGGARARTLLVVVEFGARAGTTFATQEGFAGGNAFAEPTVLGF